VSSLCLHSCNVEGGKIVDATYCVRVPFYANTVWLQNSLTAVTGPVEKNLGRSSDRAIVTSAVCCALPYGADSS
jgi:hypothetical protein